MKNYFFIFLLFLGTLGTAHLSCMEQAEKPHGLTQEEQFVMIEMCSFPQNNERQKQFAQYLTNFLQEENVKTLFFKSKKPRALDYIMARNLEWLGVKDHVVEENKICKAKLALLYKTILPNIMSNWGVIFNTTDTFYFTEFPEYVIKINMVRWPEEVPQFNPKHEPIELEEKTTWNNAKNAWSLDNWKDQHYQNISRVFYNEKIRNALDGLDLKHIKDSLTEYLFHIPDHETKLCDNNYIVIADRIENLLTPQNNKRAFNELVYETDPEEWETNPKQGHWYASSDKNADFLEEIVKIIQVAGLWDINENNVFFTVMDDIVFLNTQKPGFGGCNPNNFFHKDEIEVTRNGQCGFDGLHKLIASKK